MAVMLAQFVRESNFIEGIYREPTDLEISAHERFLAAPQITIALLQDFVGSIQPDAILRIQRGLDVRVGHYRPPSGGHEVGVLLNSLLASVRKGATEQEIFLVHHRYENLHPFTDGNGRSGRVLWLWMMDGLLKRQFLHEWYYQSLRVELVAARPHPNLLY